MAREESLGAKLGAAQIKIFLTSPTVEGSLGCLSCAVAPGTVSTSARQLLSSLRLSLLCAADPVLPARGSHQIHPKRSKPRLKQGSSSSGPL